MNLDVGVVTTAGGRKASMKTKHGAFTCHPNPLQETADYILATLPDPRNLIVQVQSAVGSFAPTYVNMQDVLLSLQWLSEHNKFYQDIQIDFNFRVHPHQIAPSTAIKSLLTKDPPVLFRGTVAQPKPLGNAAFPAPTAHDIYFMKPHVLNTIPIFETKNTDVLAFPWLFPDGRNGMHEKRKVFIDPVLFTRCLLSLRNRSFARDPSWIIYNVGYVENKQARQCGGLAVRKSSKTLTAGEIIKMQFSKKFSDMVCFSSMFFPLRGYAAYWMQIRIRLRSVCKAIGSPHLFFTLSPDLDRWTKLHESYSFVTGRTINASNIRQAIDEDCVPFQKFFHARLKLLMTFLKETQPFGPLINSFYRVEYQALGYSHAHGFLWLKGKI